jgi:hypothetical protein
MSRLFIGIQSCIKYAHRRDAVRQTWLKDCSRAGVSARFFVGRPGRNPEAAGDMIYLDCNDGYTDGPAKTIEFLKYVREIYDFDYLYKCDDDTYVNVPVLLSLPYDRYDYFGFHYDAMPIDRKWHYKHLEPHIRREPYKGKEDGPWMVGGTGYFINRRAIGYVIDTYSKFIDDEIYEDKLVGDAIRGDKSMRWGRTDLMQQHYSFTYELSLGWGKLDSLKFAALHPCPSGEMRWVHRRNNVFLMFTFSIALRIRCFIFKSVRALSRGWLGLSNGS